MPASKRIVITGITRGLGRAMAEGFAAAGHLVCGCGRDPKNVTVAATRFGSEHRFDVVNVADAVGVDQWARSVIREFGVPDLLINNAAIINPNNKLWQVESEQLDQLFAVNVSGTANTIRAFVPAMVARNSGVVVNFSSGWGRSVSAEVAPYCASKWAIEGLTLALAEELPSGMCAVPLNPGIINTDMLQSCFADGAHSYPTPQEWAKRAVPFLLKIGPKDNGRQLSVPD